MNKTFTQRMFFDRRVARFTNEERSIGRDEKRRKRRFSVESLEDRRMLANPTTISLDPSVATVATGDAIDLNGRFADADGVSDLLLAEFRVSNGYTNAPHCRVRYYQAPNDLRLYDGTTRQWLNAGDPGSGSTVSTADCTLNAALSSTNIVNSTTLDVGINLSFSSGLEGSRNVWVRAFDSSRQWSSKDDRGDLTIVPGTGAPSAPTGLSAAAGDQVVNLDWADNPESTVAGYHVYQSTTSGGTYNRITSSLVGSSNYSATGLANGTTYYYVVTAVDNSAGESAFSSQVSATPSGSTGPVAPTTISITPSTVAAATDVPVQLTGRFSDGNGIDNLWVSEIRIATGYTSGPHCRIRYYDHTNDLRLYDGAAGRWLNAGSPGSGGTVSTAFCSVDASASSTTVVDSNTRDVSVSVAFKSGLEGTRNLWLRGLDYDGNWSSKDDRGNITVSPGTSNPPTPPTGLSASPGNGQVILNWANNPESNIAGYNVRRATSNGGPYTQVNSSLLASSSFVDTGVSNGTTYYYVVNAVDSVPLVSGDSSQVSATPTSGQSGPAAPTTISVSPSSGSVAVNSPILLTGRFGDANGTNDLRLTEFRVSNGYTHAPHCRIRYYQDINSLRLYDAAAGAWQIAGAPGGSGSASTASCSIDASGASVAPVNATTLEVNVEVTFKSSLEGNRNIWLRTLDHDQMWSSADDRGDLTIVDDTGSNNGPAVVINGYTDAQSYEQNSNQQVYISAQHLDDARIDLYNLQGDVVDSVVFDARTQSPQGAKPYEDGFGYSVSFTYNTGNLPSGMYLWANDIPFIVKDSSKTSEIRVVVPTNTMAAYECSGGLSTYSGTCGNPGAANIVSFERPLQVVNLTTHTNEVIRRDLYGNSSPFLWWLEREKGNLGADYGVLSDADLDDPTALAGASVVVIPGHSEYWSRPARLTLDAFIGGGGDVAVLSGNSVWWQVRYSNDNQLIVYKSFDEDPIQDPLLETVHWDEPSLQYSIWHQIGADFEHGGYLDANPPNGSPASWFGYKIVNDNSPLLQGTNLSNGDIVPWAGFFSEYDGAPTSGVDSNGYPIIDNGILGFHKVELIGFDHAYRHGKEGFGTFIAFQETPTSGRVVNTSSMSWPIDMIRGAGVSELQTITFNILDKLLSGANIFTPSAATALSTVTTEDLEARAGTPKRLAELAKEIGDVDQYFAAWTDEAELKLSEEDHQPAVYRGRSRLHLPLIQRKKRLPAVADVEVRTERPSTSEVSPDDDMEIFVPLNTIADGLSKFL